MQTLHRTPTLWVRCAGPNVYPCAAPEFMSEILSNEPAAVNSKYDFFCRIYKNLLESALVYHLNRSLSGSMSRSLPAPEPSS